MSRIRFEWDIESRKIDRSDGEDRRARRLRRRKAYRLLALVCVLIAAIAASVVFVRQRLIDVETQFAQLLQDTVKAEVAALRIGDLNAFLSFQDDEAAWRQSQRGAFQEYSRLNADVSIVLTGNILAVTVDGARARVLVQENLDELAYARLWFYRRADNRWQHIAPDLAFWGDWQQYQQPRVRVNFRDADRHFARHVGDTVSGWLKTGCEIIGCSENIVYTIDVAVDSAETVARVEDASNHLVLQSPYTDIARADMPFDWGMQFRASQLIAESFVNEISREDDTPYRSDARFLRGAVARWLAEQFTRIDSGALLVRSLADNYAPAAAKQLLLLLANDAEISVIGSVIPESLAVAKLDWRDFIAWRLELEDELIAARAEGAWLQLVDTSTEEARLLAYDRYNAMPAQRDYVVQDQALLTRADGSVQLQATLEIAADAEGQITTVVFNLVNGVWKRAR